MKLLKLIFLGLFFAPSAFGIDAYSLKTTYSKNPIYEGETITLQFVLYGTSEFVEAEVQKFPEFRGYWTQNQVLRQGPLPLIPKTMDPFSRNSLDNMDSTGSMNQALIGSYTVTPMMGQKARAIVPMKMIIRPSMDIESEADELVIRPLPSLPPNFSHFSGAVGNLYISTDNETLLYHPDEPVTLRVYLRGKANFADITELETPWKNDSKIKLISERTFLDSTIPPTKIFEYSLLIPKSAPETLGQIGLTYFDPRSAKYESIQTFPIRLELQPAPPKETLSANLFPAPIQEADSPFAPLHSPWFWAINIGLGGFFLLILFLQFKRARELNPKVQYRKKLKEQEERLQKDLKDADALDVMRSLEQLIMSSNPVQSEKIRTHSQALTKLGKFWPKKSLEAARWVLESWDKSYAPTKAETKIESKDSSKVRSLFKALRKRRG